jgi:hypothetical protein
MGEIYRDSMDKGVTLDIAGITPASATFNRVGLSIPAAIVNGGAKVPYAITRLDGGFTVDWAYSVDGVAYTRTDEHKVITPYFTKPSLVSWDSEFAMLPDEKVYRLESIIRAVIQHITGQTFGYEYSTVRVQGSGGSKISLPKRLVKAEPGLRDRYGTLAETPLAIHNDGWTVSASLEPTWVDQLTSTNPIGNPFTSRGYFKETEYYEISGYFGYTSVPQDVGLAALILAEDYGCDESLWRDRYVDNIRASDWRLEFHGKAFIGTGNVKVDQLLQKYTLNRMVVL